MSDLMGPQPVSQGEGLDPSQFMPIMQPQAPQPEALPDLAEEDDPYEVEKVSKRESDKIVKEAKERFRRCQDWESDTRSKNLDDLKFVEGDADNLWQWPQELLGERQLDDRPTLTINRTSQHVLQVTNDQKQNTTEIVYRPVGGGATYQSAQIMQGLARHVMYQSNFTDTQALASEFQVKMGIGYWRVVTDYIDSDSFEQEIYIRPINDPFSVYLDPDIQQRDGSDAQFGFIFSDVPKSLFEAENPGFKDLAGRSTMLLDNDWLDEHHVRVVEYYRLSEQADELLSYVGPDGQTATILASKLSPAIVAGLRAEPTTKRRRVLTKDVQWFKMAGDRVMEKRTWPGCYVPIVRVIGSEITIEGVYDRKGHVRALKDPQRIYNYWASSAVYNVALQSNTPYVGAAEAIEGYETYWNNANTTNPAILPYKAYNDQGLPIPPPQRQQPPQMPDAFLRGLEISEKDMMAVTGQFQAQMGQQGNEVSGKAINARQRQGDNATYHFIAGLASAIRFTGCILLDLFPKIYDTERVIRIMSQAGEESSIQIAPQMQQASKPMMDPRIQGQQLEQARKQGQVEHALNPAVGRYEVHADVGPAYSTQRQEAWNALTQIITTNEGLTSIIGDLALKAADFPMADEAAERLKRMVPAQALGDSPPPEVMALQQQVQNLTASLAAAIQALGDKAAEVKADQEKVQIDTYKAETDRLKALLDSMSPEAISLIINDAVTSALGTTLADVKRTSQAFLAPPELPPNIPSELGQGPEPGPDGTGTPGPLASGPAGDQGPPGGTQEPGAGTLVQDAGDANQTIAGMRQAHDGQWYLPDPTRPGKYLQVGG